MLSKAFSVRIVKSRDFVVNDCLFLFLDETDSEFEDDGVSEKISTMQTTVSNNDRKYKGGTSVTQDPLPSSQESNTRYRISSSLRDEIFSEFEQIFHFKDS